MKKHLSLLFLLAAVVGLSAKTIDTKDLTVTAPDTWIAESSDVGYPISSLVTMSNASETEMLVIGVYEVDADLQSLSLIHISEPTRHGPTSRMPSSA